MAMEVRGGDEDVMLTNDDAAEIKLCRHSPSSSTSSSTSPSVVVVLLLLVLVLVVTLASLVA